ncbi:MAG: type IX secretion system membrane protein PorP/SprF [Bacteroidales bacterium]|jgi:type IX secretion system PorP/SprF family membrane protein|nr:type IX secretion system membrane protein PorP/SprF [Bacteroidales bacterium]
MRLRYKTFLAIILLCPAAVNGQDTWYGSVSGMHFMYNPAWTGAAGNPVMNLSAFSFLPAGGFGLRSVYASADSYFPLLHGGAGIWMSDDMTGEVMNDFRAGGSYAYHLRAGRDLFFNAGLTASVIWRGIKSGSIILPEDIDPFRGITGGSPGYAGPGSIARFDLGVGVSFATGPWYGGVSVMHLTRPYLGDDQQDHNRLRRLLNVTAGSSFAPGNGKLIVGPYATLSVQGSDLTVHAGAEAGYRDLIFGLSAWHSFSVVAKEYYGGFTAVQPAVGWSTGPVKIILSYSYAIAGNNVSIGGTAIVRAGLSMTFNNVEKRRVIHIIKLPLL